MTTRYRNCSFDFLATLAELERINVESVHKCLKILEAYWEMRISNFMKNFIENSPTAEYENFTQEMKVILELKDAFLKLSADSSSFIETLCLLMEQKQHNQSNDDGTE